MEFAKYMLRGGGGNTHGTCFRGYHLQLVSARWAVVVVVTVTVMVTEVMVVVVVDDEAVCLV